MAYSVQWDGGGGAGGGAGGRGGASLLFHLPLLLLFLARAQEVCTRTMYAWWSTMIFFNQVGDILKIRRFRSIASYAGFYCFATLIAYAYTNNTTRAGYSRGDQYYASFPAGTELLTDTSKLYKAALANCFEEEEWGPIEFSIMAKHFVRQGKSPYAYHSQYMAHLLSHGQLDDGSGT
ncbi:hypothetical protein CKAN_02328100 [Cinnamomum micranthum f. kanehirae]|uniref:Uncharacterized protein n=1 Tax=Cinnamomum micranthum f. kanehirae TaxID=337451 RepID=A0A3S3N7S8_9MAGN|nr:hypothetical protein CKAN_02328100 [Cinnamomum micranthum f. kanehirae]